MSKTILFFESEVDGLPIVGEVKDIRYPRIIKLTWALFNESGELLDQEDSLIHRTDGLLKQTVQITGITDRLLDLHGRERDEVLGRLFTVMQSADVIVTYRLNYEFGMLKNEVGSWEVRRASKYARKHCLFKSSKMSAQIQNGEKHHYMSLEELYTYLFQSNVDLQFTPYSEVFAMAKCYFEMKSSQPWMIA